MDDLVRWLGAQLDEDERIARAAAAMTFGTRWLWDNDHGLVDESDTGVVERVQVSIGQHIAEWDPARVLREIEAKQQVLTEYEQADRYSRTTWGQSNADQSRARTLGKVLRMLALPYADQPGYQESWRP